VKERLGGLIYEQSVLKKGRGNEEKQGSDLNKSRR